MIRTYRIWFLLVLVVALALPGARLLWWQKTQTVVINPEMAQAGETLFKHDWKPKDTLSPEGDGLGPVFNATSCVACHNQAGPGGGGGLESNVTTYTVRLPGQPTKQGVIHAYGLGYQETLQDLDPNLPAISHPTLEQIVVVPNRPSSKQRLTFSRGVQVSQRNTPALFGVKQIDEIPERDILAGAKTQRLKAGLKPADDDSLPTGRVLRLAGGRIGRFGWKAQTASLSEFVQAACANELGLGNPGQPQPTPIYKQRYVRPTGLDLTAEQCDQLTAFCASLPRPVERLPNDVTQEQASAGERLFSKIGCADCHTPKLGSVDRIYSDLLLHTMGPELVGNSAYYGEVIVPVVGGPEDGPAPSEWRTPPLWGVADSAPYLHDGRAATLEEAIQMHGGQAKRAATNFQTLPRQEQQQLIGFLKTLRAPQ